MIFPVIPGYNVSYAAPWVTGEREVGGQIADMLTVDDPNLPTGKGIYIWNFPKCGTPQQVTEGCAELGLSHVIIKIADGIYGYPIKAIHGFEYNTAELVRLLKAKGIQCWGYQFIYGNDPISEAKVGFDRMVALKLFGFVINAESYFRPNRFEPAQDYMTKLNSLAPLMPVALSSNRYPLTSWTDFPWSSFRSFIEFDMPQVYWVGAHNPRAQLKESYRQFQKLSPQLSYVPTGSTWEQQASGDKPYWVCTAADAIEFMDTAKELGLSAVNFWEYSRLKALPNVWQAIADYDFGGVPVPPEPEPEPEEEMTIIDNLKAIHDLVLDIGSSFQELAFHINEIVNQMEGEPVPPEPPTPPPTPPPPPPPVVDTDIYRVTADKAIAYYIGGYNKATPPQPIMVQIPVEERVGQPFKNTTGQEVEVYHGRVNADGTYDFWKIYGVTRKGTGEALYLSEADGKIVG